ncbi:HIRAN domain-containing protein [Algibacter mikhailovii]|uniref:HIRAN domain-containing protein n=1 Tax=Algibacter mikhailovii TaxID=425498 RepID=UPI0024940F97|nr:HIRAN domain-containing protein [Algibacter mikhailovii]
MLNYILKKINNRRQRLVDIPEDDFEILSLWTAGIKYESRINNLMDCKVHEDVVLERQPNNKVDSNAIHVKRRNGKSLGFIGTLKAKLLAPLIDELRVLPIAKIVEIKCDTLKENYGVKVAIRIKPEDINNFYSEIEEIDYNIESSSNENLYLLIDCAVKTLAKVKRKLHENDIETLYSGVSYKTSNNGKNYDWYIKLNSEEKEEKIKNVLEKEFPILKEKSNNKLNAEYLELQDEELDLLKKDNSYYEKENEKLEKRLIRYRNKINQAETQFEGFCSLLFPNTIFIQNSLKVLNSEEISDFTKAFYVINKIENDPNYKGRQIKTLDKWFDTHFNTGIKDDGRIYFKRENKKVIILVSFKKNQTSDIKLLKKHI